eukprot:3237627-Rhodomonas_salina.1
MPTHVPANAHTHVAHIIICAAPVRCALECDDDVGCDLGVRVRVWAETGGEPARLADAWPRAAAAAVSVVQDRGPQGPPHPAPP